MLALGLGAGDAGAAPPTAAEVRTALVEAVAFQHRNLSRHGGYVYRVSADFSLREAEGIPGPDTIWIQPPATPAVGAAFLDAWEVTRDGRCLEAAREAGRALARTQLASGGWDYSGHFGAAQRAGKRYRRDPEGKLLPGGNGPGGEPGWQTWRRREHHETNHSTLDDDVTQSAVRLLVRLDHALEGKDEEIRESAAYALEALLHAQYPVGGWSASFDTWPDRNPSEETYPVRGASYPETWSKTWDKEFTGCYVLNDNAHTRILETLLLAARLRKDVRLLDAAKRAGDFLLAAQLPDPQPAWAQQYDAAMRPAWSRAFEPPAVSGRESQSAMWALVRLAALTRDGKYLRPLPKAVAYLKASALPDGRISRFYELETNRPVCFARGPGGKGFEWSYDLEQGSSNYGWVWDNEVEAIEAAARAVARGERVVFPPVEKERWPSEPSDADVAEILRTRLPGGGWVETEGDRGIMRDGAGKKVSPPGGVHHAETFVENVRALSAWLRPRP
jgi:PelA/Pel-15E family pectate lyase